MLTDQDELWIKYRILPYTGKIFTSDTVPLTDITKNTLEPKSGQSVYIVKTKRHLTSIVLFIIPSRVSHHREENEKI